MSFHSRGTQWPGNGERTQRWRQRGENYSLVTSAKLNGVEPFACLKDFFTHLPAFRDGKAVGQAQNGKPVTSEELDRFFPDRWLEQHLDHQWTIDTICREERRQKEQARRCGGARGSRSRQQTF